jgi:hypothetical protein
MGVIQIITLTYMHFCILQCMIYSKLLLNNLNKLIIEYNFILAFYFHSVHELPSTRILPYVCGSTLDFTFSRHF